MFGNDVSAWMRCSGGFENPPYERFDMQALYRVDSRAG